MTGDALIAILNDEYPDDMILQNWDTERGGSTVKVNGDGLAHFIATEVAETFDPDATDEEQLNEAYKVLHCAVDELQTLCNAIANRLDPVNKEDTGETDATIEHEG